jgi:iron-sulfur cluster assembly accessory protein
MATRTNHSKNELTLWSKAPELGLPMGAGCLELLQQKIHTMTVPFALKPQTHSDKDGKGILITAAAMKQLAGLMAQQAGDQVLRVGVRSGGCSGMSYTMDFVSAAEKQPDDQSYLYEPVGAPAFTVICDPKSLLYIYGMQLDFSAALIGGGFNFTNPNASQTCGCGSSFAV